ncbi:MAG: AMIN domain-containing protein, partial [Candidatus Zixiibacteriota bacterium]
MKHIAGIVTVAVLMIAGNLFASSVDEIALSHEKGAAIARIMVDGPIRYIHQTEIPKDGKPHRVIVDILSAVHELGVKNYSDVPECPVTSIRTSQYSVTPEKIVRVVFDLASPPLYNIESSGRAVVITFQNKDTKPFANWSTAGVVRALAAKKSPQPPTKPSKSEKKPVTVTAKNEAIDKDRLASLQSETVKKQAPDKAASTPRKPASKPIVAKV